MTTPTRGFQRPPQICIPSVPLVKFRTVAPGDHSVFSSPSFSSPSSQHLTPTPSQIPIENTSHSMSSPQNMFRPSVSQTLSNPAHPPITSQHSCPVGRPSPTIRTSHSTSPSAFSRPSSTARSRCAVSPSQAPPMHITSSPYQYTLDVQLPTVIQQDMVTISANKGDRLKVIADAWHMETDCHYEWHISFPPHDIDMSSIHAKFDAGGHLTIHVRRRANYSS